MSADSNRQSFLGGLYIQSSFVVQPTHEVVVPDWVIPSNRHQENTVTLVNGENAENAEPLAANGQRYLIESKAMD